MAQRARRGGGLHGDIGKLFGARHIDDIGVGHPNRAPAMGNHHRHAHHALVAARVNDLAHLFQRDGI